MVGYDKTDLMTSNQKLIAGCLSGVVTRFLTQPMDVIKVRTQLRKFKVISKKKWFWTTRTILKEEGVTAFWHGHTLGQVYSVLAVSSQFYVYEMTTKFVAKRQVEPHYKKFLTFLCGMLAGCCSAALVIPIEVIRVRQMLVKDQYRGLYNGAKKVYSTGGILAFYEGLTASVVMMGPQVGISFCVFSFLQPRVLNYIETCRGKDCRHSVTNAQNAGKLLVASAIAGSASGFLSKTITYPLDLAKRRMQIGSHKVDKDVVVPTTSQNLIRCRRLFECMYKTVQHEGFWGLYRGWKITVYKAQLTSVVAFTSYELICYALR